MAAVVDEDTLNGIGVSFGRRIHLAPTVANIHRGKHFHAKRSRPAKEDETKKRGEGDRDGREGGVGGQTAGRCSGFCYKSTVTIHSGHSAMADDVMCGLAGTDKESDGKRRTRGTRPNRKVQDRSMNGRLSMRMNSSRLVSDCSRSRLAQNARAPSYHHTQRLNAERSRRYALWVTCWSSTCSVSPWY
jgi:hypothetical protein